MRSPRPGRPGAPAWCSPSPASVPPLPSRSGRRPPPFPAPRRRRSTSPCLPRRSPRRPPSTSPPRRPVCPPSLRPCNSSPRRPRRSPEPAARPPPAASRNAVGPSRIAPATCSKPTRRWPPAGPRKPCDRAGSSMSPPWSPPGTSTSGSPIARWGAGSAPTARSSRRCARVEPPSVPRYSKDTSRSVAVWATAATGRAGTNDTSCRTNRSPRRRRPPPRRPRRPTPDPGRN